MERRRRWKSRKRALTLGLIVAIAVAVCEMGLAAADQVNNFAQLETNARLTDSNQDTRDLSVSASSTANANSDDTGKDANRDNADANQDNAGDDASSRSTIKKTSESTNEPTTVDAGDSNTADSETTGIMTPATPAPASSHATSSASNSSTTTTQAPQTNPLSEARGVSLKSSNETPSSTTPTTKLGTSTQWWTDGPKEAPTTPRSGSTTDAPAWTKPPTNASTSDDGSEPSKTDSLTEAPTTPRSGSTTDAPAWTKPPTNASTSDDGDESSQTKDAGSEYSLTTDALSSIRTSGSSDETSAHAPTLLLTPWSPPPVLKNPTSIPKSHSELSGSDSPSSQTGSLQSSKTLGSSPDSPENIMGSPAPVTSDPRTRTRPTPTTPSSTPTLSPSTSSSSTSGASSSDSSDSPEPSTDTAPAAASRKPTALDDNTPSPAPVTRAPALRTHSVKTLNDGTPTTASSTPTLSPSTSSSSTSGASSSDSSDSPEPSTDTAPAAASRKPTALDDNTPSPAPVTRAPALRTHSVKTLNDGNDVSQTEQTSLEMSSSESNKPSPAPVARSPSSKAIAMLPSLGLPDSIGTVMPADISDSAAEKVEEAEAAKATKAAETAETAEAVTKQTDSGSRDEADKNTIKDNDMILLGDTGSMMVYSDGNKVTTFEKYNRGDDDLQTLKDEGDSYNNIIVGGGNRSNLPPGASISLSSASQKIQNTLLYTSYALGVVSTVLLMFFHMLALHRPVWLGGTSHSGDQGGGNGRASMGWLTPNVWELVVVVGYIQHISSISMLELTKAPQIVLDFTDSFSFANLHLSLVKTTAVSEGSRRLQLVILTGIVAFSDRIGVNENEVLLTMFWFFLVAIAILGVLFASAAGFTFYRQHLSASTWSAFSTALRSSFAMCVVGLGVAAWVLSVFPLVVMSSYELVMQLRYRVGIGLAVALFSLWAVVAGGLSYAFVCVRAIPMKDAFRYKHFAVWGSLYGDSKMVFRYFFVVTVSFQILLGIITGAVSGVPTQLVALMVTHLLFVVVALIIRPFAAPWVLGVVVSLRVIAIANLLCSFAFLTSSTLSIHWRGIVAQGFVAFNAITLILFFARYIAMFVLALKRWSSFTSRESVERYETEQRLDRSHNDRTPIFLTHDIRNHRQLNDGENFIASDAGFAPSRGPEYSSGYSSGYSDRYKSTHVYSSRQRYAPTPTGSSAYSSP